MDDYQELFDKDSSLLMDEYRKKILMSGLLGNQQYPIAPFGIRHKGDSAKGKGFFGLLPSADGNFSTEISSEDEYGEFPLMVPTLTKDEMNHLLSGNEPTESIYQKAISWADFRRKNGLSPFKSSGEITIPVGLLD